ncbi:MAG: tetratricopeptide repeat protein [Dokdonia sp.]|uniref:tetratricopeptide repeat protein n=1 Tax=Dokdonia sp. TaxID=2024995 RepID=UPI003263F77B
MALETILIFVANSIAGQIVNDTWKDKVVTFFWPKASYPTRLYQVILKTIQEFEKEQPTQTKTDKFPFYKSQMLFEALSLYILFEEGPKDAIDVAFEENANIIVPTKEDLDKFYKLFLFNANQDQKLKTFFIRENYQGQIFTNTEKLKSLSSLTASVKGDTQKIIGLLDRNSSSQIPKELTTLLPKLEKGKIIGRNSELKNIKKSLFENKQVVLVNGMGGIGKTTLATVYLTEFYNEYTHIAWISATQNGLFNDVVSAPGLLESLRIELGTTPKETYNSVKASLNSLPGKNLLIIDNATEDLATYASHLPSQPNWHLVITSREKIDFFDNMEIGFLSEPEAIKLFKKHYTLEKLKNKYIRELVKNVEYHTLTIEILAKTAQELRTSPTTLNEAILSNMETDIIIRHSNKKVGKILSYLTSIFDMSELTENGITLLKYITLLPSEYLKNEDLEEVLHFLSDTLPRGRAELFKKGWILYNQSEDAYKLHQIIQDVVKSRFTYDTEFLKPIIDSLKSVLTVSLENRDNPVSKFKWIPYGKEFLSQLGDNMIIDISKIQNNLALVLKDLGDYEGAKELLEKVKISAEKNFGENHPTTAIRYSNLALVLKALGDYEGAKQLLEKAKISDEKNFGEDHPTTAIRYSNLALVLQALRDYEGAKQLLEKAYQIFFEKHGDHHPTTKIIKNNLISLKKEMG